MRLMSNCSRGNFFNVKTKSDLNFYELELRIPAKCSQNSYGIFFKEIHCWVSTWVTTEGVVSLIELHRIGHDHILWWYSRQLHNLTLNLKGLKIHWLVGETTTRLAAAANLNIQPQQNRVEPMICWWNPSIAVKAKSDELLTDWLTDWLTDHQTEHRVISFGPQSHT